MCDLLLLLIHINTYNGDNLFVLLKTCVTVQQNKYKHLFISYMKNVFLAIVIQPNAYFLTHFLFILKQLPAKIQENFKVSKP